MNLSAKTEYACIAVLELALRYESGRPVRVREIADANGIPARFLVQILLQLKSAGIVGSTRGAAGGYQLMRKPDEITLGEVMAISEGQAAEPVCNAAAQTPTTQTLLRAWKEASLAHYKLLASVNFGALVEQVRGQTEFMYHI